MMDLRGRSGCSDRPSAARIPDDDWFTLCVTVAKAVQD